MEFTQSENDGAPDKGTRYQYRITKVLAANNFEKNKVYDMTSALFVETEIKTTDY